MPTVPSFDAPRVQPARTPNLQSNPGISSAAGLSQGLDQLSGILEHEQFKADRTAVIAADTSREQWANSALYDPQNGAFNRQGKDALGVTGDVLSEYDKHVTQTAGSLNGRRQSEAYMQSSQQQRQTIMGQLSRFEFEQRGKYEDQTNNGRISTAIQTGSLNYNDPASLGQSRSAILGTLQVQGKDKGWSDDEMGAQAQAKLTDFHTAVIQRMLSDSKTGLARKYLNASKGELDAKDEIVLSRAIDTMEREKKNELAGSIRQQAADLSASYKAGLPVPSGQELSPAALEIAYPGKGQAMYKSLEADRQMGADLKDMNQLSPTELSDRVGKYVVTQGGTGARESLDRQSTLERAADESMRQRRADPVQFAINNGLGFNPLNGDPDAQARELQSREANQLAVREKVGGPVPLLSTGEAKAIGSSLDETATPKEAIGIYNKYRSALGDDAYKQVMQQIAVDSPVKAYAGQIYGNSTAVTTDTHWFKPNDTLSQQKIAETMLKGERIVNQTKGAKSEDGKPVQSLYVPPKDAFDSIFVDTVGDAFRDDPKALSLAQQAAYAYYVGDSAEKGRLNQAKSDIKSSDVNAAIARSIGQVTNFHSAGNVVAPLGMDIDTFENKATEGFMRSVRSVINRESSPQQNFAKNSAYAKQQDNYLTTLPAAQEEKFQAWVKKNNVPFDPSATADYDMRGFYKDLMAGGSHAQTGMNANDGKLHFGDYFKTPYHKSFSAESEYATAGAPKWNDKDQLVTPDGRVVFDERAIAAARKSSPQELQAAQDAFRSLGLNPIPGERNKYYVTQGRSPFRYRGEPLVVAVDP